jgi:hypothetical protein
MLGTGPVQPGFASRVTAFVLAGLLALELQADLAERWANPDLPEAGVAEPAAPPAIAPTIEPRVTEVMEAAFENVASEPRRTAVPESPSTPAVPEPVPAQPPRDVAEVEPAATEPVVEPRTQPAPTLVERCDALLSGSDAPAPAAAAALLHESGGAEDMIEGLIAEEVPADEARFRVLRTLSLAGRDEDARELARRIKQESPAASAVAIRELDLLRPRIVDVDSFVDDRSRLVVTGAVRNEDVAAVRRVRVVAELLDPQGNVIAAEDTRVKPKLIDAALDGSFTVRFGRDLDPAEVDRTRVTVVRYEYEVVD